MYSERAYLDLRGIFTSRGTLVFTFAFIYHADEERRARLIACARRDFVVARINRAALYLILSSRATGDSSGLFGDRLFEIPRGPLRSLNPWNYDGRARVVQQCECMHFLMQFG